MTGPRGVSWHDLPPEQAERYRRINRYRRKMKEIGQPFSVPPDEARERVRALHDKYGMTFSAISAASPEPLSFTTVRDLYHGHRKGVGNPIKTVTRRTHDKIMAIPVPEAPLPTRASIPIHGTQRRLQALAAVGYGAAYLARERGCVDWSGVWRITVGRSNGSHNCLYVAAATRDWVVEAYERLKDVDPVEAGVHPVGKGRTIASARRKDFAPPHCWDADTIDDPEAFPEWTGACGTVHGRTVHEREGIPVCAACKAARGRRRKELAEAYTFNGDRLYYLMERAEISKEVLADALGVNRETVWAWRSGRFQPNEERLESIADYFGIHPSELKR